MGKIHSKHYTYNKSNTWLKVLFIIITPLLVIFEILSADPLRRLIFLLNTSDCLFLSGSLEAVLYVFLLGAVLFLFTVVMRWDIEKFIKYWKKIAILFFIIQIMIYFVFFPMYSYVDAKGIYERENFDSEIFYSWREIKKIEARPRSGIRWGIYYSVECIFANHEIKRFHTVDIQDLVKLQNIAKEHHIDYRATGSK